MLAENFLPPKNKITKEIRRTVTDEEGVMLLDIKEEESYTDKEPSFVKMYLDNLSLLHNITKGNTDILTELLKYMSYNDNLIILNPYVKGKIIDKLNLKTMQSLNNALSKLTKAQILFHEGRGTYKANPYLFGKGEWKEIRKIRMTLTFEEGIVTQKSDFEYNEDK